MMLQTLATVLHREAFVGDRLLLALHAPELASRVGAGQLVALQAGLSPLDPLARVPVPVAGAEPTGTIILLFAGADPRPPHRVGDRIDLLGPIGKGWHLDSQARNILLLGTETLLGALRFMAQTATRRAMNVTLLIGANDASVLPPSLFAPTVEYQVAHRPDEAEAALDLLDRDLLRWADALYTTLPIGAYPSLAERVRASRVQWRPGFAHGLLVSPMACFTGICDTCIVPEARRLWRACVDGPQGDVRDFVR
jgi:dihydroorotate dehydrogenase electron transfer subunit